MGRCGLDQSGSRQELGSSCEHKNKPSYSIKYGKLLDLLRNFWCFKKDSAPSSQ